MTVGGATGTDTQIDDSQHRRADALELSGWGERFTFVQPHNLCFWVYIAVVAVGVVQAWGFFAPGAGFYVEAFAIGAGVCLLCGFAWFAWFRHIDRWERQPGGLIVAGLVWGAIAATFGLALTVNTAMLSIYGKLFGQDWAADWGAGATAPITEEVAKLCGFILLWGLAPRLIRTVNDGLILGAFIGLGFATFENLLYVANSAARAFGTDPISNAVQMSATRIAVSFVSHPLFSALVCAGLVYLIGTKAQPRRVGPGVFLIVAGVFFHFTWDDALGLGGRGLGSFVVMFLSIIVSLTLLLLVFRRAAPREHQFVRDILAPEVDAGTLSDAEIDEVLDRKARKAARKSAPGRRARRARTHLNRAVLDLAHDVAQSKGADTAAVEHSRKEVQRLRSA